MRRIAAAILVVALSCAVVLPATASPRWAGREWSIFGRLAAWLSGIFEKEGSQQDPWGPPGQASQLPPRPVIDTAN